MSASPKKAKSQKSAPVGDSVVKGLAVTAMHALLCKALKPLLGDSLKIASRDPGWMRAQVGPVYFSLVGKNVWDRFPIRPLATGRKPSTLEWSVAWSEKWVAKGRQMFRFESAGWQLFCGRTIEDQQPLLRAEWDSPVVESSGDVANTGQPHWHFHHVIALSQSQSEIDSELEELHSVEDVEADRSLDDTSNPALPHTQADLHRFHLGMAGWRHPGTFPRCWQFPIDEPCDILRLWSVAVLEYIQAQLPYVTQSTSMREL
jgi:hypothetical protein